MAQVMDLVFAGLDYTEQRVNPVFPTKNESTSWGAFLCCCIKYLPELLWNVIGYTDVFMGKGMLKFQRIGM